MNNSTKHRHTTETDAALRDCPWVSWPERIRAPNSSSSISVQQSVGSSPGRDTCSPEQDTIITKWVPVGAEMVLVIDLA